MTIRGPGIRRLVAILLAFDVIAGCASAPAPTVDGTLEALYNGSIDGGVTYAIGAARRVDGTWSKVAGNPILEAGAGWEAVGVKDPALLWDGEQYRLYYSGYAQGTDGDYRFQIGLATSADLEGPWNKNSSSPVIASGAATSTDEADAQAPVVWYTGTAVDGHTWWMWYTGTDAAGTPSTHVASSDDGNTWIKRGLADGPVQAIIRIGETFHAYSSDAEGLNHMTFTSPLAAYSPSPGNPVIRPRRTIAGTSTVATSDIAAGGTVVKVAPGSAAGFEIGEPVIIVDDNGEPEVGRVLSTTDSTVALTTPTLHAYTVDQGFTIRSLAYTFIDAHAALALARDEVDIYGTTLRALDGLQTNGNRVWEGTLRYVGDRPDGPRTIDYDLGLVFPLGQLGEAWDSVSAENISIIHAPAS